MSRKKNQAKKNKKKFLIIVGCYILTFVLTSLITLTTMAWYSGSTYQSEVLYMGGPVYIYFSDASGVTQTSGQGQLVTETPPGWTYLYPGMNINFQAKAVVQGHTFTHTRPNGDTFIQFTTGAVLRARIMLDVVNPSGEFSLVAQDIYHYIWPQLKNNALTDMTNEGQWVMDVDDEEVTESTIEEDIYFYYIEKTSTTEDDTGDYQLLEVGGLAENVSVGFLNNTIIQLPPVELTNDHADCRITFTIVFEAVQAFFPYEQEEVGNALYQGDTTGRDTEYVTQLDVGLGKPLIIKNSRKLFKESKWTPENGWPIEE